MSLPTLNELKAQAKRLRAALDQESGSSISHGQALELIARQHGFRDWNTLHAAKGNRPELALAIGDRVTGTYLNQPFKGEVLSITRLGSADGHTITLQFDEAVDVVTFDSFSNYRHRVTTTVLNDGSSQAKTGNGVPQMQVHRDG